MIAHRRRHHPPLPSFTQSAPLLRLADGAVIYKIFDKRAVNVRVEEGFGRRNAYIALVLEMKDRSLLEA
jgi:hypothetical protein